MYEVHEHRFGRKMLRRGPMSGCMGFEEHEQRIIAVVRRKQAAIDMAANHPFSAAVTKRFDSVVIFDNGKEPGNRTDDRAGNPMSYRKGDEELAALPRSEAKTEQAELSPDEAALREAEYDHERQNR